MAVPLSDLARPAERTAKRWLSYKNRNLTEPSFRGKLQGMKICSLLPSATEILFALGLGDQVAGVSHECDFPPEARTKPVLIKSRISHTESAAAIDRQVREFLERGESLYSVDFELLRAIEPDLIVTQDLCHVCAATPDDLGAALAHLERQPRVVTLNPHSLADVCADIRAVGEATGRAEQAKLWSLNLKEASQTSNDPLPGSIGRASCASNGSIRRTWRGTGCRKWWSARAESMSSGAQGKPSFRVEWETALAARPEVIVDHAVRLQPCSRGGGVSQSAAAAWLE